MKKFLLGMVGLVALAMAAGPAFAADLAARPIYTKAPPMVAAVYDWTGVYIGINGGWGSSHNCWDATTATEGCHDSSGGTVGGQLGYRWQASQWVFGVEAQGNWADFAGSNTSLLTGATNRSHIDSFGLFTGQIGYAWNNALLYVKGGAAVTNARYDIFTLGGSYVAGVDNQARWGSTVGVGIEYTLAPNWSAALEYDHLFMGSENLVLSNSGTNLRFDNIRQDVDLVTVRLNYRWGESGGLGSRY